MRPTCTILDCQNPHEAKGLCRKHYRRLGRTGTVELRPKPPPVRRECSLPDCTGEHIAKGYCRLHWERMHHTGTTDPPPPPALGCTVDGCDREHSGHGLCKFHVYRLRANGDPTVSLHERTPAERFWPRVDRSGGPDACWPWLAGRSGDGYGTVTINYVQIGSHRVAYELAVGPIPAGLTIDHLCRNTICQNPAHMEPVTQAENTRRAKAAVTHCPVGHAYDDANTRINVAGARECRACGRGKAGARAV